MGVAACHQAQQRMVWKRFVFKNWAIALESSLAFDFETLCGLISPNQRPGTYGTSIEPQAHT
eukprot:2717657-Amphidinium_carterae.2